MTALVPARVLVKGASSSVAVAPTDGPRHNVTFERWLEDLLPARGLPVHLRNTGREGQRIRTGICNWALETPWSPDVVILNYGMYECVNSLLPWQFERHANTKHRHPGAVRDVYRRRVLRPAWRTAARVQRKVEQRVSPPQLAQTDRHIAELAALISEVRAVARPLVLVMDLWAVAPPWSEWFVGLSPRAAELNKALAELVESLDDPEARVFPLREIVDRYEPSVGVPDGMHFAAEVHEEIARRLADEILGWAADQPHLQHPGLGSVRR